MESDVRARPSSMSTVLLGFRESLRMLFRKEMRFLDKAKYENSAAGAGEQ